MKLGTATSAAIVIATIASVTREAAADESNHDRRARELREKIEEAELQSRYESIVRRTEEDRDPLQHDASYVGRFRKGRVVLPELFGLRGSTVLGGPYIGYGAIGFVDNALGVSGPIAVSWGSAGGTEVMTMALTPSLDVFVTDHLTIGGAIAATRAIASGYPLSSNTADVNNNGRSEAYSLAASPRIGYAIPLGKSAIVWPKLALDVSRSRSEVTGQPASLLGLGMGVAAESTLLFPMSQHVFIAFSPHVGYQRRTVDIGNASTSSDSFMFGTRAHFGVAF